ncbi:MAG: hypothetical protein V1716_03760, partial [Candidatus Uhrbacteria bacterium]
TFDMTRVGYIGGGEALYFHATSHELVIYDKIADLTKPKSRATDKQKMGNEKALAESFPNTEILRFEARLCVPKKKKEVLEKFGVKNQTLENVFNKDLSRKILLDYWNNEIKKHSFGLFSIVQSPHEIFHTLKFNGIKPNKIANLVGWLTMAREKSLREIKPYFSNRQWLSIKKELDKASDILSTGKLRNWAKQIDDGLEKFDKLILGTSKPP